MEDIIEKMFRELVKDFNANRSLIFNPRFYANLRIGSQPEKGTRRDSSEYTISSITGLNHNSMIQGLRSAICNFDSTTKIVKWVIQNGGWPKEVKSVEEDLRHFPSISANIAGGFLMRNFEINNNNFEITDTSFHQTLQELKDFFVRDNLKISVFLSLHGPSGDLNEIRLSDNISVQNVDFRISKLFNAHYSSSDGFYIDMFEGDYILKAEYSLPKQDFMCIEEIERPLLNKWFIAPLVAGIGNIEKGKIVRESIDWPLLTIRAPNIFYYNVNKYNNHKPSNYKFTKDGIPYLETAVGVLRNIDLTQLDMKIHQSIHRLQKAKATTSIDDKIVELALALEYLINTEPYEVALQLRLKGSKLYNVMGEEQVAYDTLKKFYSLRSKVVHGNSTIEDDNNTKQILDTTERILIVIILKVMELNKIYSFKQISEALHRSLYLPQTFEDILARKL